MKQIIPPELVPFNRQLYFSDLDYRTDCDHEIWGERRERISQLFATLQLPFFNGGRVDEV